MSKSYSDYTLANTIETNNQQLQTTGNQNSSVQNQEKPENEHKTVETNGIVPQSEVFPTLLKGLGEHREITFFQNHVMDLPVLIYDSKEGLNYFSSLEKMEESGKFIMNTTHKVVRKSDNQPPTLDLSVTSLVFFQWLAMFLTIAVFAFVRGKYKANPLKAPKGVQNMIEKSIVWLRAEVIAPNIPSKKVVNSLMPYFTGLFYFIFGMNVIGLVPGGHTATGAIGVTAALAVISFFVINISAISIIGFGGFFKHLLGGAPWWLIPIMLPIEIVSLFTKPFALTIRLFANMTAGHIVLIALVGLIFFFRSLGVAPISVAFSVFMYFLEALVAFLQAYIFTMLTAVFTGLAIGDHGHDEHH